ncbi:hypothetical protein OG799_12325 [Micromonospora sp. NBC_00898]|uniref:hypothetical protein n=1 Tax=Micromonospora sp. NBC_00898 TaxID=2975981 RepID=UPI003869B093|nr:hypothetical protein OG799_12325 [Micromonospora sp. NBC_00898]
MPYSEPTTARRTARRLLPLALALAALLAAGGMLRQGRAEAADQGIAKLGMYLGKWNYDQPDRVSMTNIAVMNVPGGGLQAPQIGDIVFTAEGRDRVVGRTDVGCTWRFRATARSLELDPPSQLCHNPTLNVSYTIIRWTVTVSGQHEKETITAKSHRAGRDYDFVLEKGARTKVKEYDPHAATKFTGIWTYDPSAPKTRVNIRVTQYPAPEGAPTVVESPQQGRVTIVKDYDNRVTARTDDGCTWSLLSRGNTAKLDPPTQTCTLRTSAAITLKYWTITTDGRQQTSMMIGIDERGGNFVLSTGSLTKH